MASEMTDTEINEFCARELGWQQHHTPIATTCGDGDRIDWMNPKGELVGGEIPDFLNSESANAMLLEKMGNGIVLYRMNSGKWYCGHGFPTGGGHPSYPERLRAVANYFIEWRKHEH